ncbi:MAG: GntR family transcriptional regulator [Betaproteobacteria bacterium]
MMDKLQTKLTAIVDALEEDILFGRLRPRERLIEDELIERFKASRHAVRQALVDLERKGMVIRQRNRGAVVRDFTKDEVEHICAVREMLHAQAAAMIPLPPPATLLRRLDRLHGLHSREVERGNPRGIHQVNSEFHDTLFQACGNPYLVETIRDYAQMSLGFRCQLMVNPFLARRARDEHAMMIEALKKGDRAKLVRLCSNHTNAAKEVYFASSGLADPPTEKRKPAPTSTVRKPAARTVKARA